MPQRNVPLVSAASLPSPQRERFAVAEEVASLVADELEVDRPLVQVVRGSFTGVWADAHHVVLNLDVADLAAFDGSGLRGLVAHEVGHIAAGHLRGRRWLPFRGRAREMEANRLAASVVGWGPLVDAYLASVNRCAAARGAAALTAAQVAAGAAWPYPEASAAVALLKRCLASAGPGTAPAKIAGWGGMSKVR